MRSLIALAMPILLSGIEASKYLVAPFYEYRGPPAPLSRDGTVMDTPEVMQARDAHMAAHTEALARLKQMQKINGDNKWNDYGAVGRTSYEEARMIAMRPVISSGSSRMRGDYQRSAAPLSLDGRVIDTPEVARAKAAHMAAYARALARATPSEPQYNLSTDLLYVAPVRFAYTQISPAIGYRGPSAPLGPDGRVLDTPDVARARAVHMKAHAHAVALASRKEIDYY